MLQLPRARLETLWLRFVGGGTQRPVVSPTSLEHLLTVHFAAIVVLCTSVYLGAQVLYLVRLRARCARRK